MNFLSGYTTYLGGIGQILTGMGGLLTHELNFVSAMVLVATGLTTIGARRFGQKILDVLKTK